MSRVALIHLYCLGHVRGTASPFARLRLTADPHPVPLLLRKSENELEEVGVMQAGRWAQHASDRTVARVDP